MTSSFVQIRQQQQDWANRVRFPSDRPGYLRDLNDNLALGRLNNETHAEFKAADGEELLDTKSRPAKMRALVSSSALAVNFFDSWRNNCLAPLQHALGLEQPIASLKFEHKCSNYPVGPRTANLDLLLTLQDKSQIGVESKFTEPFRTPGVDSPLSLKYHPPGDGLWASRGLAKTQALADSLRGCWDYLDVPQLLKHILGLRGETRTDSVRLLYLWFDTGLEDAEAHRDEVARFRSLIQGDDVRFLAMSYQTLFARVTQSSESADSKWSHYMTSRYFSDASGGAS